MITIFLVIGIIPALIFAFYIARGNVLSARSYEELSRQLVTVDIAAFRNLVDPNETLYLRAKLAPAAFRAVQRQRQIAALAYVKAVAHNAALLLAMASPARTSPQPEIASIAQAVVEQALRLRIRSTLSSIRPLPPLRHVNTSRRHIPSRCRAPLSRSSATTSTLLLSISAMTHLHPTNSSSWPPTT